jgi:Branched-chain amino acid ABC-type transport system, permease components
MAYFSQQLINAITLGAIYGLIAIGYTMVYGIIGMINFAHGEVFMIGAFISLIGFMICAMLGIGSGSRRDRPGAAARHGLHRHLWLGDRAHRLPAVARSFKLAPLISAIGVSIMLQNYVQLGPGCRPKPAGQIVEGGFNLFSADGFDVRVAWLQIIIVVVTVSLMAGFSWLIASTSLGRQQRACEQDMKMARCSASMSTAPISLTFVMGAAWPPSPA